jgi:DNA-binding winged helix-turn-helix (wHTH) protein/Tfp pilus assembly protein PilF
MGSAQVTPDLIRFGVFEADLRAGELRRSGVKVRLQDLPFRVLAVMLSRPGHVISREELRQALWPADVFVDFEQGISSAVMRLRDALRDSADNPIFIETIERRGYRWIGPIQPPEPAAQESQKTEVQGKKVTAIDAPVAPEVIAAPAAHRSHSGAWRRVIFIPALLLMLVAAWVFRPGHRDTRASTVASIPVRTPHAPANRDAEDLYLKGRFYWNKRTPESLNQAVDAFSQAIARDPNYAEAYVGLADCYNLLREFSAIPANEAYFKAFAAAKKAVELDPDSADAHASLAFVSFWGMWDANDAEKEFRRAIELDPNNAKAHHWFATFLHGIRRHDEALAEIEVARKLDPNASSVLADQGLLLWEAGHREEGVQLLKQLEAAEPGFASPHRYLRFAYFATSDDRNYLAEFKAEALLTHDDAQLAQASAAEKGFTAGGERGMLQSLLAEQMTLYTRGKLSPYILAETEGRLGNSDETLKYLTMCVQSHDALTLNISEDENFNSLRHNPAFEKLIAIIGLPAAR